MQRFYEVLFVVVFLTILGDYTLKLSTKSPQPFLSIWFLMGVIFYGFTALGWVLLMQNHDLSRIAVIYSSVTTVSLVFMGHFFFGEIINSRQGLGIVAALAAVILIES